MELNNNDAAVRSDSADVQTGTVSADEIDLYDELLAFAELPPDEQLRLLVPKETGITSADPSGQNASSEQDLSNATSEPVELVTSVTEAGMQPTEGAEIHTSPEPVITFLIDEPVEVEPVAEAAMQPTEEAEKHAPAEKVLTYLPSEPVEAETAAAETVIPRTEVAESESAAKSEVVHGQVKPDKGRPAPFESRPSGPLSGFSLTPEFVFTGAMSRGVCLGCGAESGADDLFCMTCGVFMDEIGSTLPFVPTCVECKQGIAADEIFCPWCGAVLPV